MGCQGTHRSLRALAATTGFGDNSNHWKTLHASVATVHATDLPHVSAPCPATLCVLSREQGGRHERYVEAGL